MQPGLVGLARVSTDGQDAQLQRDALTEAGCRRASVYRHLDAESPAGQCSWMTATTGDRALPVVA
jgi:hypothetical protein